MRRLLIGFIALMVLIFLLCVATLCFGAVNIPFADVVQALFSPGADVSSNILWNLRIPKMIAAVLAGASLAVSGLSLQTVFRNPLAGPFVLGISSGASLGVALALLAGIGFGSVGVLGSAALGALLVTLVVMFAATRFAQTGVLLIVGLLTGYFIDSIVSVLIAGNSSESLRVYVAWGMGSFGRVTLGDVWIFVVAVIVGMALIGISLRYLNAALLGDDFAHGLGLNVKRSKICVLLGASLLAGATTAFCGPVAFIGIAVPHLAYLLFKTTNHRVLLPGAALCGVALALLGGLFPASVPLNAVLSLVGVPVIMWVLVRGSGARF